MQSSASSGLSSNNRILIVSVCAEVAAAILERSSYDISLGNAEWAVCRERCPNVLEPIREQLRADLGRVGEFLTSRQSYGSTQRAARSWCLHPNDVSLSGELGTTNGPAGEKPPPQGNPTPRSKTAARPNSQRLIAPPPQKSPDYSSQRAQCIHGIIDYGLFFNVISRRVKQFRCPQNQSSASASSCGSLTQSAGWTAKPLLNNAIGEGCLSGSMLRDDLPTHLEGTTNLRLDQLGVGVCLVTEWG